MRWQSSSTFPHNIEPIPYIKHRNLAELIEGKSLAYVCPSPHLIDGDGGSFIDSHDVVVRAGNFRAVPENLHKDYGKRTDVLVHSFNELEIPESKKHMEFLQSTRHILCPMVSTDFFNGHNEWINHLHAHGCNAEKVDDRVLFPMFGEIGTICNVGLAGLLILLKYDIREIYITGMTFYNMGGYGKIYTDDHYDVITKGAKLFPGNEKRIVHGDHARSDIHAQEPQIKALRKLAKEDSRIKLDGYLHNNLFA